MSVKTPDSFIFQPPCANSSTQAQVIQLIRLCDSLRHSSFVKRISFWITVRFTLQRGKQIVAEEQPEQVAKVAASYTGRFLAGTLMPATDNNGSRHL